MTKKKGVCFAPGGGSRPDEEELGAEARDRITGSNGGAGRDSAETSAFRDRKLHLNITSFVHDNRSPNCQLRRQLALHSHISIRSLRVVGLLPFRQNELHHAPGALDAHSSQGSSPLDKLCLAIR